MSKPVINFAERAQLAIDFSGLSVAQLRDAMVAAGCDVSLNHCYRLMRGEIANPKFDTVAGLVAATGVPANWFFDRELGQAAAPETLSRYMTQSGTVSSDNPDQAG